MDIKKILKELNNNINSHLLKDHEKEYIDNAYKNIIYANRPAKPAEKRTLKKIYQLYLKRKLQNQ